MAILEKFADTAYALLRIMSGFMFGFHGVQKLFNVLTDQPPPDNLQVWIGGFIELAGGLAILVGLKTRWAAFICSGTMAVAYFQFHWKLALDENFFPGVNHGEMAVLYCLIFLYMSCRGGVKWCLDPKG